MVAPNDYFVELYTGIGELPHFNPDDDREGSILPATIASLRDRVAAADALLISSPEYAHGVPGSLKNALDWLVSGPEMIDKPVALLQTSTRAIHAPAALTEILLTMSARVVSLSQPAVPLSGRSLAASEIVGDPQLHGVILDALRALHLSANRAEPQRR